MSKTILAIALCIFFVAFTQATVELTWATDLFLQSGKGVHNSLYPINIKTTAQEQLGDSITFTPALEQAVDATATDVFWSFVTSFDTAPFDHQWLSVQLSHYGLVADTSQDDTTPCFDSKTKQNVAYLKFTPENGATKHHFTLESNSALFANVDGDYQNLDVICFVVPTPNIRPTSIFFDVAFTDSSGSPDDVQVKLTVLDVVSPVVNFKALSYAQTADVQKSSKIDIEFTTDTLGAHTVTLINASFFIGIDATDGKIAPHYCSSGSTTQFASLTFYAEDPSDDVIASTIAVVDVRQLPAASATIKCTFYTLFYPGQFVRSERSSLTIGIGNVRVARSVNVDLYPGVVTAQVTAQSTQVTVGVTSLGSLTMSSTPLNTNSTVEFVFSKHFDVTQISNMDPAYRAFACKSDWSTVFEATASVDAAANSVVLKDVEVTSPLIMCEFVFVGSNVFSYDAQSRQGSVVVKIDGQPLRAFNTPGNAVQLYLSAQFKVNDDHHFETATDTEVSVTDIFSIHDLYSSSYVAPRDAVVVLALTGRTYQQDNAASQLTCKISTPTDTALADLKLSYDAVQLVWSASLPSITNIEVFALQLECQYKVKRVFQYGLEVTPRTTLTVQVFDLVDKKRYATQATSGVAQTSLSNPSIPAEQPSGAKLPGKTVGVIDYTAKFTTRGPVVTNDEALAAAAYFADMATTLLPKVQNTATPPANIYADFKFKTASSFASQIIATSSQYTNLATKTAAAEIDVYAHTTLASPIVAYLGGPTDQLKIYDNDDTNAPITTPYMSHAANAGVTTVSTQLEVEFVGTAAPPTDAEFSFTRDAFDFNLAKVRDTDFVFDSSIDPDFEQTPKYYTPLNGCGVVNGFRLKATAFAVEFDWQDVHDVAALDDVDTVFCPLKGTCTMDADCSQPSGGYGVSVCKSGTCTLIPQGAPTWVSAQSVGLNFMMKQFYNSSIIASTFAAFIMVVVALMF